MILKKHHCCRLCHVWARRQIACPVTCERLYAAQWHALISSFGIASLHNAESKRQRSQNLALTLMPASFVGSRRRDPCSQYACLMGMKSMSKWISLIYFVVLVQIRLILWGPIIFRVFHYNKVRNGLKFCHNFYTLYLKFRVEFLYGNRVWQKG